MSDAQQNDKQLVTYLLGAVVVLLVVIVAIVVWQNNRVPGPVTSGQPTQPATNPGMAPSQGGAFDPEAATKVPAGQEIDDYVSAYYQAILDEKWDDAFKMQPAASQQGGDVEGFKATQQSYGMESFEVKSSKAQGETGTVEVEQNLGQNGIWGAVWTFVKTDGEWVVKSRAVSMK